MDAVSLIRRLKAQARSDRDRTIRDAREGYHATMADIRRLSQTLTKVGRKRKIRRGFKTPSVASLVELILSERGPMTLAALAVEIRDSGLRDDEPGVLLNNLRASMRFHVGTFRQDGELWRVDSRPA